MYFYHAVDKKSGCKFVKVQNIFDIHCISAGCKNGNVPYEDVNSNIANVIRKKISQYIRFIYISSF